MTTLVMLCHQSPLSRYTEQFIGLSHSRCIHSTASSLKYMMFLICHLVFHGCKGISRLLGKADHHNLSLTSLKKALH